MIATLAVARRRAGHGHVVVTGDRDSYQLVRDPHIKVLYNKRGVSDYALYDEAGIVERTGVTPAQYVDYAALRGDKSDNLPGVPGIGEKTAAKLITTYGGLEGIFEHLDDLPPKQRTNLGEFQEQVFHNREMSVLRTDLDLELDPDDLRMGGWDREAVQLLFQQLEFRLHLPAAARSARRDADEEAPVGAALDATVRPLRSADDIVEHLQGLAKADERYVIEPRWDHATKPHARSTGSRSPARATTRSTCTSTTCATRPSPRSSRRWSRSAGRRSSRTGRRS